MYILLENNAVKERIPDVNPDLPEVAIEDRYHPDFVANLIYVEDGQDIPEGYIYDAETGTFSAPPEPEPAPVRETIELSPTQLDIIEAQVTYTAMMTDTLLEV